MGAATPAGGPVSVWRPRRRLLAPLPPGGSVAAGWLRCGRETPVRSAGLATPRAGPGWPAQPHRSILAAGHSAALASVTAPEFIIERRQRIGLFAGPVLLVALLLLAPPAGMSLPAWRTAAVGIFMACWWISEAIPIPATALTPLLLFPLLGILPIGPTAAPYANPIIFLFLGGFVIALAMERHNLHRRIALRVVRAVGVHPPVLILGFMLATAFMSMWVSNTATVVMMLPIGLSVVRLVDPEVGDGPMEINFAIALMLGIAYAASIGGLATLIGTPPNALLAAFMRETYDVEIGFAQWMLIGLPLVIVALPVTWVVLTRLVFPIRIREIPGGAEAIRREYEKLGPVSRAERSVAVIFVVTALLWITRPLLDPYLPGLSDTSIAIAAALATFIVPVSLRHGEFLMDWETAERLPWGVLLLFGGGLALAGAITTTGLAGWIGEQMTALQSWPLLLTIMLVTAIIIFLTELTSNTATAAAFLPLVASLALGIGENPFVLLVPAALAASCAFMLPVATPPNAIVYGSGHVTVPQMARAGIWLNLLFIALISLTVYTLVLLAFGVEIGSVPDWTAAAMGG
ncbi:MAG: DASS family sodium-coupled anion symporter [Gemmatimonadetes bacterium]|nr:DASS family sodium-coupled anion symporter [Gemmatimonadota bacterium]